MLRHSPFIVYLEEIIELGLIIATASGTVYLLDAPSRRERDLVRCYPNHGSIYLMEKMNISRSEGIKLVILENPRGEEG